jgi:hypothetical protein
MPGVQSYSPYRFTTVIDRHEEPTLLKALMVMVLVPVTSGTLADHIAVPEAGPEPTTELVHVTDVVSADAVPLIVITVATVETMVEPGEVIASAGGAVAGGVGLGGGFVAASRVMLSTRDAMLPAPSDAVTVMIFVPRFSGTRGILHVDEPVAFPDSP